LDRAIYQKEVQKRKHKIIEFLKRKVAYYNLHCHGVVVNIAAVMDQAKGSATQH